MTLKAHYKELFSINESNFNLVKLKYSELSNKLGIENRCGDSVDILSVKPIDYGIVNKKIQDFRENSTEILIKMLEKE